MRRIAASVVVLALLGHFGAGAAGAAAAAQLADFDARCAQAQAALEKELESYIAWCQSNSLFNERRKAYELLLELAPEHAEARKTLGHVRAKDGTWKAPEKPKAFRDFDKKALAEAPARWKGHTQTYVDAMLALLEEQGLADDQRERAAAAVLHYDPDNERVHTLLGEVRGEKGWVLPETVAAKAQREVLRAHVKTALEGAPVAESVALTEREKKIPLPLVAVAVPGVRVVGTTQLEELRLAAQAVVGLQSFLQAVFASKHALPKDLTVFLLAAPEHKQPFIASHPLIRPEQRAYYEKLEGGGVQGTSDFAFWTGDMQRRIDGVVRLLLGYWLSGAFEITVDQGWAYEGFGLFLTRALVRTRMTWLAQPSRVLDPKQDVQLRQKLMDPETNWMDEALRMLEEKRQTPLVELFKKDASGLSTEDVLYSYTLATYLLEARPADVPGLLGRVGKGYAPATALQETLALDLAAFERHLARWLKERT
jgi:hypothetical protein